MSEGARELWIVGATYDQLKTHLKPLFGRTCDELGIKLEKHKSIDDALVWGTQATIHFITLRHLMNDGRRREILECKDRIFIDHYAHEEGWR